ncbi:MAG: putative porin [Verrucomicrobia bacterium]|nr:putative porin [Verrucomicrobiota bacterium]
MPFSQKISTFGSLHSLWAGVGVVVALQGLPLSMAQDPANPLLQPAATDGLIPPPLANGLFPSGDLQLEDPPSLEPFRAPTPAPPAAASESVVVNLINHLVAKGILSQGEAADMMIQAQRDAQVAQQNAATAALVAEDLSLTSDEDVVVSHVPEPVKERLQAEISQQIIAQAKAEAWGASDSPEWARKMRFFSDFRTRNDFTIFPDGNDTSGSFPDFNRINRNEPFDVAGIVFSPQRNVAENRNRHRIRARFGTEMDLGDRFTFGARLASGSDINPVSTNQTLSGGFQKYQIWLDQAFLRWDGGTDQTGLRVSAGRMPLPFFRTSVNMWDDDLNFDGLAFNLNHKFNDRVAPFVNAGIFPVFTTLFDEPFYSPNKAKMLDKWLQAIQIGTKLTGDEDNVTAQLGAGIFHFDNIEGKLSDPYVPLTIFDAGNTDDRRPTFAQKGNTYMALRNILPDPLNDFGASRQFQYYGLASKFNILGYNGRVDFNFFEPFQISLLGDISTNLAFNADDVQHKAVNNRGPIPEGKNIGPFDGGANAWNLTLQLGPQAFNKKGDWNAHFGYRFIESDAVVDGFNDSAFGLGGTNMEGVTIGGGMAVTPRVSLNLRWMGANEITGPPLKSDIIQLDLNARF